MNCKKTARLLSYLAAFLFNLFVSPTTVRCNDNSIVPVSGMNKTLRDHIRKQRFLKHVLNQLKGADSLLKNSSSSAGPSQRGAFSSLLQETNQGSNTPSSQHSYNITSPDKPDHHSSLTSFNTPNLVVSEREDKNILTFKFRPRAVKNKTLVNKIHLWLYVRTKDKGKSQSPTSQSVSFSSPPPSTRDLNSEEVPTRRKGKRIKIRVFLSDASGGRGPRIAELKTRVQGSTWGKLGLPVSLINTLAEAGANNTLRLRVECKRCSGKTQVVMPSSGSSKNCLQRPGGKRHNKKKDEKTRRLRKHCADVEDTDERLFPFIVIEEKSKASGARIKREAEPTRRVTCKSDHCSNHTAGVQAGQGDVGNVSSGAARCCRLVNTYVQFSRLSLDHIVVYPSGFEYATCIQDCHDTPASTENNSSQISNLITQRIRLHDNQPSQRQSRASGRLNGPRHFNYRHKRQYSPLQQYQHGQQHSRHWQPRLHRWFGHKWNRLKPQLARPMDANSIVIVYLTDGHKLAQTRLPNVVITQCGCKNHFVSTKDKV
ncbi:hypothetical protein BsWGS_04964 [Bradybaena similaris]